MEVENRIIYQTNNIAHSHARHAEITQRMHTRMTLINYNNSFNAVEEDNLPRACMAETI